MFQALFPGVYKTVNSLAAPSFTEEGEMESTRNFNILSIFSAFVSCFIKGHFFFVVSQAIIQDIISMKNVCLFFSLRCHVKCCVYSNRLKS